MSGTLREALTALRESLRAAGIDDPRFEAEVLAGEVLGVGRGGLLLRADEPLAPADAARLTALGARRAAHEPLQHVVGHWPFLELELAVDRRALVPRPETEDVVLAARALVPHGAAARVADVGTGSGCIALAIAHSHPQAQVVAIDRSAEALALARENAARCGLSERVHFVCGDLLAAVGGPFNLVVANLPYVRDDELAALAPEVREHDPHAALLGGADGLDLVRALAAQLPQHLVTGGWAVLEVAPAQTPAVAALLRDTGLVSVAVGSDRFGRTRVVRGRHA